MNEIKLLPLAQRIYDLGGSSEIEDDDELENFACEISCSDGFGYGLFDGGYISPSQIMADPQQIEEMNKAIALVEKFKRLWENISMET